MTDLKLMTKLLLKMETSLGDIAVPLIDQNRRVPVCSTYMLTVHRAGFLPGSFLLSVRNVFKPLIMVLQGWLIIKSP